jgi:hypothetical protein
MGSWIKPNTYSGIPETEPGTITVINGYKIQKPRRFKNKAHERAFEIALSLAIHKPMWSGVTIMTTSECIDAIMFNGIPEIQLNINAKNPRKVAHDAMELVPSFFEAGKVNLDKRKHGKRMWFLEILKP